MGRVIAASLFFLFLFINTIQAQQFQHGLKIGTQIPLQYNVMYEFQPTERFSLNAGIGAIAPPYPTTILNILGRLQVTSAETNKLIEDSYDRGVSFEGGANLHFGKNYVRLFGQYLNLSGEVAYTDIVKFYSGLDFNFTLNRGVDITSSLTQAGILFGHRFLFTNPRHQIHAELSVSKTIAYKSKFETGSFLDRLGVVQTFYKEFDRDIDKFFRENSYVPTLNLYYVYKF